MPNPRPPQQPAGVGYPGMATPSMTTEAPYISPAMSGPADYPESQWTSDARQALNQPQYAAYEDTMAYGQQITTAQESFVTWDYASPFLYAKASPLGAPYPYILIPQYTGE